MAALGQLALVHGTAALWTGPTPPQHTHHLRRAAGDIGGSQLCVQLPLGDLDRKVVNRQKGWSAPLLANGKGSILRPHPKVGGVLTCGS